MLVLSCDELGENDRDLEREYEWNEYDLRNKAKYERHDENMREIVYNTNPTT